MSNNYYNNSGYENQGHGNDYYNQHPQQYQSSYHTYQENVVPPADHAPENGEKGLLGAVSGGIGGGILGKQSCHGFLGTVGGALIGSVTEDFIKKKRNSRPSSPQPGANNSAHATATATATANASSYGGHSPMATPVSPPTYCGSAPPYASPGMTGHSTSSTTTSTTSYFQYPCMNTPHPCVGSIHHCVPSSGHGHGHYGSHNNNQYGNHSWNNWHK